MAYSAADFLLQKQEVEFHSENKLKKTKPTIPSQFSVGSNKPSAEPYFPNAEEKPVENFRELIPKSEKINSWGKAADERKNSDSIQTVLIRRKQKELMLKNHGVFRKASQSNVPHADEQNLPKKEVKISVKNKTL